MSSFFGDGRARLYQLRLYTDGQGTIILSGEIRDYLSPRWNLLRWMTFSVSIKVGKSSNFVFGCNSDKIRLKLIMQVTYANSFHS